MPRQADTASLAMPFEAGALVDFSDQNISATGTAAALITTALLYM